MIFTYLRDIVFNEDASYKELLTVAAAMGAFWVVFFQVMNPILRFLSYDKPWLRLSIEREYSRADKEELKKQGTSKEEFIEKNMKEWPNSISMSLQHVAGALGCIPFLLGIGDPSWAVSIACLGGLSEMGFDDTVRMYCGRFFAKDGEKKYPNAMLILGTVHHSLSITLCPPMIQHYRYLRAFHWSIFELQLAGGLVVLFTYAGLLDTSKPGDLRQFKAINLFTLAFMVWSRGFHWFYNLYQVLMTMYNDKAWGFLAVGGVIGCLFSLLNAVFISGMYKRWKKFRHMSAVYESLPADATEKQKRQSVLDLQEAVNDLLLEQSVNERFITEDRIRLFLDGRAKRSVERRHTLPPRQKLASYGSTRLMRGVSVPARIWKGD